MHLCFSKNPAGLAGMSSGSSDFQVVLDSCSNPEWPWLRVPDGELVNVRCVCLSPEDGGLLSPTPELEGGALSYLMGDINEELSREPSGITASVANKTSLLDRAPFRAK